MSLSSRALVAGLVGLVILMAQAYRGKSETKRTQPQPENLYERITEKLAADPDLAKKLDRPPAELAEAQWLVGDWVVTAHAFATATTQERTSVGTGTVRPALNGTWLVFTDIYPKGSQDLTFLTFNQATRKWVGISLDTVADAVVDTSDGWHDGKLVFQPTLVEILGERVRLRQTIEKRSQNEYRLLNEQQLENGSWVSLDEYIYRRK